MLFHTFPFLDKINDLHDLEVPSEWKASLLGPAILPLPLGMPLCTQPRYGERLHRNKEKHSLLSLTQTRYHPSFHPQKVQAGRNVFLMHSRSDLEIRQGGEPFSLKNLSLENIKATFFKIRKKRNISNHSLQLSLPFFSGLSTPESPTQSA